MTKQDATTTVVVVILVVAVAVAVVAGYVAESYAHIVGWVKMGQLIVVLTTAIFR